MTEKRSIAVYTAFILLLSCQYGLGHDGTESLTVITAVPVVDEPVLEKEPCPCIMRSDCPRIYGENPLDFQEIGPLDNCTQDGFVRCCGVSVSVVHQSDDHFIEEDEEEELYESEQEHPEIIDDSEKDEILVSGEGESSDIHEKGEESEHESLSEEKPEDDVEKKEESKKEQDEIKTVHIEIHEEDDHLPSESNQDVQVVEPGTGFAGSKRFRKFRRPSASENVGGSEEPAKNGESVVYSKRTDYPVYPNRNDQSENDSNGVESGESRPNYLRRRRPINPILKQRQPTYIQEEKVSDDDVRNADVQPAQLHVDEEKSQEELDPERRPMSRLVKKVNILNRRKKPDSSPTGVSETAQSTSNGSAPVRDEKEEVEKEDEKAIADVNGEEEKVYENSPTGKLVPVRPKIRPFQRKPSQAVTNEAPPEINQNEENQTVEEVDEAPLRKQGVTIRKIPIRRVKPAQVSNDDGKSNEEPTSPIKGRPIMRRPISLKPTPEADQVETNPVEPEKVERVRVRIRRPLKNNQPIPEQPEVEASDNGESQPLLSTPPSQPVQGQIRKRIRPIHRIRQGQPKVPDAEKNEESTDAKVNEEDEKAVLEGDRPRIKIRKGMARLPLRNGQETLLDSTVQSDNSTNAEGEMTNAQRQRQRLSSNRGVVRRPQLTQEMESASEEIPATSETPVTVTSTYSRIRFNNKNSLISRQPLRKVESVKEPDSPISDEVSEQTYPFARTRTRTRFGVNKLAKTEDAPVPQAIPVSTESEPEKQEADEKESSAPKRKAFGQRKRVRVRVKQEEEKPEIKEEEKQKEEESPAETDGQIPTAEHSEENANVTVPAEEIVEKPIDEVFNQTGSKSDHHVHLNDEVGHDGNLASDMDTDAYDLILNKDVRKTLGTHYSQAPYKVDGSGFASGSHAEDDITFQYQTPNYHGKEGESQYYDHTNHFYVDSHHDNLKTHDGYDDMGGIETLELGTPDYDPPMNYNDWHSYEDGIDGEEEESRLHVKFVSDKKEEDEKDEKDVGQDKETETKRERNKRIRQKMRRPPTAYINAESTAPFTPSIPSPRPTYSGPEALIESVNESVLSLPKAEGPLSYPDSKPLEQFIQNKQPEIRNRTRVRVKLVLPSTPAPVQVATDDLFEDTINEDKRKPSFTFPPFKKSKLTLIPSTEEPIHSEEESPQVIFNPSTPAPLLVTPLARKPMKTMKDLYHKGGVPPPPTLVQPLSHPPRENLTRNKFETRNRFKITQINSTLASPSQSSSAEPIPSTRKPQPRIKGPQYIRRLSTTPAPFRHEVTTPTPTYQIPEDNPPLPNQPELNYEEPGSISIRITSDHDYIEREKPVPVEYEKEVEKVKVEPEYTPPTPVTPAPIKNNYDNFAPNAIAPPKGKYSSRFKIPQTFHQTPIDNGGNNYQQVLVQPVRFDNERDVGHEVDLNAQPQPDLKFEEQYQHSHHNQKPQMVILQPQNQHHFVESPEPLPLPPQEVREEFVPDIRINVMHPERVKEEYENGGYAPPPPPIQLQQQQQPLHPLQRYPLASNALRNSPFGPFPSTDHWSGIPSANSPKLPEYFEQNKYPPNPVQGDFDLRKPTLGVQPRPVEINVNKELAHPPVSIQFGTEFDGEGERPNFINQHKLEIQQNMQLPPTTFPNRVQGMPQQLLPQQQFHEVRPNLVEVQSGPIRFPGNEMVQQQEHLMGVISHGIPPNPLVRPVSHEIKDELTPPFPPNDGGNKDVIHHHLQHRPQPPQFLPQQQHQPNLFRGNELPPPNNVHVKPHIPPQGELMRERPQLVAQNPLPVRIEARPNIQMQPHNLRIVNQPIKAEQRPSGQVVFEKEPEVKPNMVQQPHFMEGHREPLQRPMKPPGQIKFQEGFEQLPPRPGQYGPPPPNQLKLPQYVPFGPGQEKRNESEKLERPHPIHPQSFQQPMKYQSYYSQPNRQNLQSPPGNFQGSQYHHRPQQPMPVPSGPLPNQFYQQRYRNPNTRTSRAANLTAEEEKARISGEVEVPFPEDSPDTDQQALFLIQNLEKESEQIRDKVDSKDQVQDAPELEKDVSQRQQRELSLNDQEDSGKDGNDTQDISQAEQDQASPEVVGKDEELKKGKGKSDETGKTIHEKRALNTNKKGIKVKVKGKSEHVKVNKKDKDGEKSDQEAQEQQEFQAPKVIQRGFHPILPYSEKDPGIVVVPMPKVEKILPPFQLKDERADLPTNNPSGFAKNSFKIESLLPNLGLLTPLNHQFNFLQNHLNTGAL